MVFFARIPFIIMSGIFAVCIYIIARRFYGTKSAMIALILYAFNPNILGHNAIVHGCTIHDNVLIGMGAIATGLFATLAINSAGANGLFYGNPGQFLIQLKAVAIVLVYSGIVSYGLLKVIDAVLGLRVNDHEERVGLDLTQHREAGYTMLD